MVSFVDELRAKQQQIMGNVVYRGAVALQDRLVAEAKKVAAGIPGAIVQTPPGGQAKTMARATEKVFQDYGGNWLDIKDIARCTLVVPNPALLDQAVAAVKAHFRASNGFTVFEEKIIMGHFNDAGYSGLTVFVQSGGNKGEVQINTPALMYAKSLPNFRDSFPNKETEMKAKYPLVEGGLGHTLYETSRAKDTPLPVKRAYAHASKLYYNYFRSFPPNMNWGMMARDAIKALKPPPSHA